MAAEFAEALSSLEIVPPALRAIWVIGDADVPAGLPRPVAFPAPGEPVPEAPVGPGDTVAILYTSGTTGKPKGCAHTHRGTMHTLVGIMRWHGLQPTDTLLAVAPWFHVTGMQSGMNGPLYLGATQVVLPRWDRDAAVELIERYRVKTFSSIPTMVQDLLNMLH